MKINTSILFLAVAAASFLSSAQAQTRATVDQFLSGLLSISGERCQNKDDAQAKQYESQGRLAEAHSIRSAEKMICECMPARVRELRVSLPKEEANRNLSEAEFGAKYTPKVINKCAADQLRSTYGEGCAGRFAKLRINSEKYCSCMFGKFTAKPDEEIAEIASASADYIPKAADAKKRGLPQPERPAAIKLFTAVEASCMKE